MTNVRNSSPAQDMTALPQDHHEDDRDGIGRPKRRKVLRRPSVSLAQRRPSLSNRDLQTTEQRTGILRDLGNIDGLPSACTGY